MTQGPCSLRQFRGWLDYLSSSSEYKAEFAQFKSVEVWKTGMPTRLPLLTLLGQLEARAAR